MVNGTGSGVLQKGIQSKKRQDTTHESHFIELGPTCKINKLSRLDVNYLHLAKSVKNK